jgi:hypothetical protein
MPETAIGGTADGALIGRRALHPGSGETAIAPAYVTVLIS